MHSRPMPPRWRETSTTIPRLPLIGPTSAIAKFTSRRDTPPYSMSPPARMNRGAEMRGKESRTVKNRWGTTTAGTPDPIAPSQATIPMATPTCAPATRSRTRAPKRNGVIVVLTC